MAHILTLERQLTAYRDRAPFSVRLRVDPDPSGPVARLVAVKNLDVEALDVSWVLLAGEILYQLRSALDHLIHQLVMVSGNAEKLKDSRRHQFPIFDAPDRYSRAAARMIDGVSDEIAMKIERQQPYRHRPDDPKNDALWMLQDVNNTDKHRLVPVAVVGIAGVIAEDSKGTLFRMGSPDIILEHERVFFSFTRPTREYDDIRPRLTCAVAFQQAMQIGGNTMGMDGILMYITSHVGHVIDVFRPLFPTT